MPSYDVTVTATVTVKIADEVTDAFTRTEDPNFRNGLYGAMTAENVLYHLAYNCVSNGVDDACRLDGWADLDRRFGSPNARTIKMDVTDVQFEYVSTTEPLPELAPARPGERTFG